MSGGLDLFVLELTFSKNPDSFSSESDLFYTLKCEEPIFIQWILIKD